MSRGTGFCYLDRWIQDPFFLVFNLSLFDQMFEQDQILNKTWEVWLFNALLLMVATKSVVLDLQKSNFYAQVWPYALKDK